MGEACRCCNNNYGTPGEEKEMIMKKTPVEYKAKNVDLGQIIKTVDKEWNNYTMCYDTHNKTKNNITISK